MDHVCPDCGARLQVLTAVGGRTLACPSCHGRLYGLSPFEKMLAEGAGARVWTGSAAGAPAGKCPYCSAPMLTPTGDADAPDGMAVCRRCQEVWVPADAEGWMAAHAATTPGPVLTAPTVSECGNCGAPYQPDEDGRCHWCHTQIAAAAPIVVMMQRAS